MQACYILFKYFLRKFYEILYIREDVKGYIM